MTRSSSLFIVALIAALLPGCGDGAGANGTAASVAVGSGSPAVSVSAATSASSPRLQATTLKRKATPSERFAKDDAQCKAGDRAACRSLADRYSGAGVQAGCGVPRERALPSLKRVSSDADSDWKAYVRALTKACELGDEDACALARFAPRIRRNAGTRWVRWDGVSSAHDAVGIRVFRSKLDPVWAKTLVDRRNKCLGPVAEGSCDTPTTTLFKKRKAPADGKLTKELQGFAEEACKQTRDCDEIYMMLDKEGYSPEELAPVRSAFATTLVDACVEGDCTCGEATKYLPADDARRADLAILGCENGEAEGCYALARLYENGTGVDKSETRSRELYDLACPPIRPQGGPFGEYSPHACDRLADLYVGGPYPGKDRPRGKYYAEYACRHPGREFDHAPCVRLGLLWSTKRTSTGRNGDEARSAAWGNGDEYDNECHRPSVKEQCAEFKKSLAFLK
jgi:TPR repeat protein